MSCAVDDSDASPATSRGQGSLDAAPGMDMASSAPVNECNADSADQANVTLPGVEDQSSQKLQDTTLAGGPDSSRSDPAEQATYKLRPFAVSHLQAAGCL